jgi:membrane-associated phospholipid phosphatase
MDPTHKRAIASATQALALMGTLVIGVDAAVIRLIHRNLTPTQDHFFDAVSGLANATILSFVALGTYGASRAAPAWPALRRWLPWWERARQGSLLMLLTLLTGGLVTLTLKHMVARARPSMLLEHGHYGLAQPFLGAPFNSFPSSHALTAFAAAFVLARLHPAWRAPLLVLAVITGLCRVLTLEHFPSDVLASAFIAAWCVRFWAPRVQGPISRN